MRRLTTGFCSVPENLRVTLRRFVSRGVLCLLAVAGVSTLAPVSATEPAKTEVKPNSKGTSARAIARRTLTVTAIHQRIPVVFSTLVLAQLPNQQRTSKASSEPVAIPECLEKLTLSQQQQVQIREIVGNYDTDLVAVWRQFSDRYMETVRLEASLLAAIEDNLTEPQRQQVREQRRKMARHEKSLQGTDAKPNQATAKPTSAVEEEITIAGVSLTPEQEATADKIQEKYLARLRSLNRDIQGLHTRLVSLEADKLVQIEKVLTKDQLVRLRESRQTAPYAAKIAASKSDAVIAE